MIYFCARDFDIHEYQGTNEEYKGKRGRFVNQKYCRLSGIVVADFDHLDAAILEITQKVLNDGLPKGVCLNVNFPMRQEEPMKGVKVCRQAACRWVEYFNDMFDEEGKRYYNLEGTFESDDIMPDTDLWALQNNYISVVPTCFDWTAHAHIEPMKGFENISI